MKKILTSILLGVGLVGCTTLSPLIQKSVDELKDLHIKYVGDKESHGVDDYWQTPDETRKLRKGDCEDSALLLDDILKKNGVNQCKFLCGKLWKNKEVYHCWIECTENGKTYVIETTNNTYFEKKDINNLYWIIKNPDWERKREDMEKRRNE